MPLIVVAELEKTPLADNQVVTTINRSTSPMEPSKRSVAVVLLAAAVATVGITGVSRRAAMDANRVHQTSLDRTIEEVRPSLPTRTSIRIPEAKSPEVPRFSGYITNGSERWFALSLPTVDATKEQNEWLTIGQKIGVFEIKAFDIQQEALSLLNSGGERIELRVAESTVNDSPEQLKRRWRNLIDTSPRAIRDLYQPVPTPLYQSVPAPSR